ncbi:MAG: hypothetical protein ACT4O2_10775, partial [Beijerinckiaceae bacterium]
HNRWPVDPLSERGQPASDATNEAASLAMIFTNRTTDLAEKWFARVDVTEEFPFLVAKLPPYYDR